ncbi:hypothetical protein SAY87_027389 [Trapa incisa]|uniref:PXMP2/4 family protein 4 n=1 Tax=Trapa incisa TaxID=236973 RepID=A0AAN7H0S3_9MYRT|nr:hypothetical protein SAY87_027389 [Trapa incisa]
MSGGLVRRSSNLLRTLQKQEVKSNHGHPLYQTRQFLGSQTQSRPYLGRFPNFPRKTRECSHLSPAAFSSSSSSSSSSGSASSKVGLVRWYLGMVKSRPIVTKSLTCALIYTAADLSSQTISKVQSDSYDLQRTLRMAWYGMAILGPSLHFWFNLVSKLFPKRDLVSTLKKMVMGQAIYGPIMTVVFFCVSARLKGETDEEIIARLKRDLIPTLLSGVMYWPMCDFITFKFLPVHLQPLMSNSFSYLWTIYLTYMASLEKVETAF